MNALEWLVTIVSIVLIVSMMAAAWEQDRSNESFHSIGDKWGANTDDEPRRRRG